MPTPTSIVRHSRIHSINSTHSTNNGHASALHEHAYSSPSHVGRAAVYFNTWTQKVNLAGSAFMIGGTSGSNQDMDIYVLRPLELYLARYPFPTLAHTVALGKPLHSFPLLGLTLSGTT